MATPITWQNINAPSFGEANRLMGLAQQSILGAFEGGKTALAESQAFDKELWKRQDADFTQRQLAAMYAAKTPEALAALQASGQMANAVGPDGARADMAVINEAMDKRPSIVQNRRIQDIAFTNAERENLDAPILAQSRAALLKKDYAGVANLASQMSPQAQAVIGKELDAYQRELVVRSQTDNKAKAELENFAAQRDKWKADSQNQASQLEISRGQLGVSQQNARTQANEARLRGDLAAEARLQKNLEFVEGQIGGMDAGATTNSGYKKITDWLSTVKNPKKNELLTVALGKARADGDLANKSASQVIAAMQADIDTGNLFDWSDNTGDKLKQRLSQFNDDPIASANSIIKGAQLSKMRTDLIGRLYPGVNERLDGKATPDISAELAAAGVPAYALPGASIGKGVVAAPTPQEIAFDSRNVKPLPSILNADVDARVAQEQATKKVTSSERNMERLAKEAKLNALREEASGITPARISVLTPSEANNVLSKYGQVLPADLQRLLRKQL